MCSILDDPQFPEWDALPGEGDYHGIDVWSGIGELDLDKRLTALADLYRDADASQRAEIRSFFDDEGERLDELWLYVRRMARLVACEGDDAWLTRALAIAVIEGGRIDARDSIVSLVLLRYGSERAGIDPKTHFDAAIALAPLEFAEILRNARDHPRSSVEDTVAAFGPPDW